MEVKDLMVGDWVSVSGTPMQVACIGINKIAFEDQVGRIFSRYCADVEPIQMTAEILEKNGWMVESDSKTFKKEGAYKVVQRYLTLPTEFYLGYIEDSLIEDKFHAEVYVRYLHVFQHALKLFDIEQNYEKVEVGHRLYRHPWEIMITEDYEEVEVVHKYGGVIFYVKVEGDDKEIHHVSKNAPAWELCFYPKVILKPSFIELTCSCPLTEIKNWEED